MMAEKERKGTLVWPAFIQPKLNGVRCLVRRVGNTIIFTSRKAKVYKNFNLYMEPEFLNIMDDGDILYGEMYNHGDITFQELKSLIKNEKTPDLVALKKYVKFYCYDRPHVTRGFEDRFVMWIQSDWGLTYFRRVLTYKIYGESEVMEIHGQFMEKGYEGSNVRSGGNEPYNFQYRDNQLQKNKDFLDYE